MKIKLPQIFTGLLTLIMSISILSIQAFADGTAQPVTGISVTATSATKGPTSSNGTITISRKGKLLSDGTTATVTISNSGGAKAKISFDYAKSGDGTVTLNGTAVTEGTHIVTLDAGGTVPMTVQGTAGYGTATLTLSNFSWTEVAASAIATVEFDSNRGSVTLGGKPMNSGDSATATGGKLDAVATPASGYTFIGWLDSESGLLMSASASASLDVPQNTSIRAVFVSSTSDTAWFKVDDKYLTDNLTTAGTLGSKIVLANNGTLSGSHTIPSGVTLLIPNDDAGTVYTTTPGSGENYYEAPSFYRTLTMESGANITVNGAISVAGKQGSNMGSTNGNPCGPLGRIDMAAGSSITVNSGANLYTWGYITGSGSVEIKSGGAVYEDFQITDWRGGTVTSGMLKNKQKVFPLSQYYIQNIQVPLTIHAGATEYVCTAMTMSGIGLQQPNPAFIGNGGMFVINSGTLTKDYIEGKEGEDRTVFTVKGNLTISNMAIELKLGIADILGASTINSRDYLMPIRSGMTIEVKKGSTVNMGQDLLMQPDSLLIVEEGATITAGSGKGLYVYDAADWGRFCFVSYLGGDKTYGPVKYVPTGRTDRASGLSEDAQIQLDGTFDFTNGSLYTTNHGANISSTGTGKIIMGTNSATQTHQYSQTADDDGHGEKAYVPIGITSAQLKNGNGEYVTTESGTYNYINKFWHKSTCEDYKVTDAAVAPTCTETGLTEGEHCDLCGKVLVAQEVVPALGHTEVIDAAVAATCTETGKTEGKHCSVCNEVLVAQTVVDALGHTAGAAATCTTAQTCTICGTELTAALGHAWNEATCTAPKTCSRCGATEGEAVGHSFGTYVSFGDLERAECKNCNAVDTRVVANHTGDNVVIVPEEKEGQTSSSVDVGMGVLDQILDRKQTLQLNSKILDVVFNDAAVGAIIDTYTGKSTVSLVVEEKPEEEDRLVFDLYLCVDGEKQKHTDFDGKNVTVTIPLDQYETLVGKKVTVQYRPEEGAAEEMESTLNRNEKSVQFTTSHFSTYTVLIEDCFDHEYGEGDKCTICGAVKDSIRLRSAALNLLDKVSIIYKCSVDLTATKEADVVERGLLLYRTAEAAATRDPKQAFETVTLEPDPAEERFVGYKGETKGIDARDMDKSQFVVAYLKMKDETYVFGTENGNAQTIAYSPQQYCKNQINNSAVSEPVKNVCRAMMHYGAAAQVLQYGMNSGLMNAGFEAIPYDANVLGDSIYSADPKETNGMQLKSMTMDLRGAISYIIKYEMTEKVAGKDLYAEYSLLNQSGSVKLVYHADANRWWATISGVPAKDLGAALTVTPYYFDENGAKVYGGKLVYSGNEYARRTLDKSGSSPDLKSMAQAMAMYVYYADQYGNRKAQ